MVVVWAAWVAWTLLSIRADARAADAALKRTRATLDAEAMLDGTGVAALGRSAAQLDDIAQRLDSPGLAPLRFMPIASRQLSAASHQADAAAAGLRTAVDVGNQLEDLVDSSMRSGPERVAALHEVEQVARRGRTAFEDLDLGPDEALIGPLNTSRTRIEEVRDEALDLLGRASDASRGMAAFFEGPHDYLLLAANNAQMQNGQGMFLSAGVLHVADGRMDLDSMEPTARFPAATTRVPLDPDLAARWGWLDPNDDFRHLGLSHRFPVTAQTAAALWQGAGRPPVDGVMVVDPFVLRAIMEASGPVETLDGEVPAAGVVKFALHDQYMGYLDDPSGDGSYHTDRRDQLEHIAEEALADFDDVESVEPEFVEALSAAARGRHLLLWSPDPELQAGWEAAGVDGQIPADSALLSIINRSGNKLDWFIRTSADLVIEPAADGYEAEIRVTVRNEAPVSGQPAYVVGPYPGSGLDAGEYLALVTLNLPEGATNNRFDGVDALAAVGADGANRTIAAWVRVPSGGTTELVARFHLPAGTTGLRIEPSGRATPTLWFAGEVRWRGPVRWRDSEARTVDVPDQP